MANHASATKAHRQSLKHKTRNRSNTSRLRSSLKAVSELISAGKADEARAALPGLYAIVDRSVQKGVLNRNAAARHKSRFTRSVNAVRPAGAG